MFIPTGRDLSLRRDDEKKRYYFKLKNY